MMGDPGVTLESLDWEWGDALPDLLRPRYL